MPAFVRKLFVFQVIILAVAGFGAGVRAADMTDKERSDWLEENADLEAKLMVPVRDGVRLATDV